MHTCLHTHLTTSRENMYNVTIKSIIAIKYTSFGEKSDRIWECWRCAYQVNTTWRSTGTGLSAKECFTNKLNSTSASTAWTLHRHKMAGHIHYKLGKVKFRWDFRLRADCSMLRLTRGFTNQRLTLTPGLTSHAFFHSIIRRGTMRHELTREIPRVNLVVNSNLWLEQPALRERSLRPSLVLDESLSETWPHPLDCYCQTQKECSSDTVRWYILVAIIFFQPLLVWPAH